MHAWTVLNLIPTQWMEARCQLSPESFVVHDPTGTYSLLQDHLTPGTKKMGGGGVFKQRDGGSILFLKADAKNK